MSARNPLQAPDAEAMRRVRVLAERQMGAEEFEAYVKAPMSTEEREEILASVAWFTRRYPTAGQRLAAARRWQMSKLRPGA
jgi:hypothetical protein